MYIVFIDMKDITDINRFIDAQNDFWGAYDTALREVQIGKKMSHWIWFVFPQLRGLGSSEKSIYYGIADRNEVEAFLSHPILGVRLREITNALLQHDDRTATDIFERDALKVKSSMTLFDCISPNDIFGRVLEKFYQGKRDVRSIL